MDFAVIDVNFLAHLPTIKGQPVSTSLLCKQISLETDELRPLSLMPTEIEKWKRNSLCTFGILSSGEENLPSVVQDLELTRYMCSLSTARNVVLFGTGAGCSAVVTMVQHRGGEPQYSRYRFVKQVTDSL